MTGPFTGLKVIDLSQGDGAPYCGMQLGDAGADVIKVEPLEGDWARHLGPPFDHGDGPLFMGMNRNKRSIALDLEKQQGREIVRRLARMADIFLESFQTEAEIKRLGFTHEELSALNPRLIYCDVSYFERNGPQANKPATDLTVQSIAGLMRFVGERGKEPVKFGENYTGVVAGMYAMQAIIAALFWRLKSGLGQKVETSYLRTIIATQTNYFTGFSQPDDPGPAGGEPSHMSPPSRGYKTKDGYLEFGFQYARGADPWGAFCDRFGIPEEIKKKYTSAGVTQRGSRAGSDIRRIIEDAFKNLTTSEAITVLDGMGFMCAPAHDYDSMFKDEGVLQQQMLLEVSHPSRGNVKTTGLPWKFTGTPGSIRLAPPLLGEHTDEILREAGYSQSEIEALHSLMIVR